jgi:uncharacterized damage-inducible protein DinB
MLSEQLVARVRVTADFLERSTACLTEEDSRFATGHGLYSVAAQVEHVAGSIDWFLHGMFSPSGFDLGFEKHIAEAKACTSLDAARAHFKKAVDDACASLSSKGDGELMTLLPDDSIFAGVPRAAVIDGLVDHTAHHRGALAVYARLIGKVPAMPYE